MNTFTPVPDTHPAYTKCSSNNPLTVISYIKEILDKYGHGKYVNFTGMDEIHLQTVQAAFPNHTVRKAFFQYYEVRPL